MIFFFFFSFLFFFFYFYTEPFKSLMLTTLLFHVDTSDDKTHAFLSSPSSFSSPSPLVPSARSSVADDMDSATEEKSKPKTTQGMLPLGRSGGYVHARWAGARSSLLSRNSP